MEYNTALLDQIFNKDGVLLTYEEFLSEYNILVSAGDYAKVFGAVPPGVCKLLKSLPRIYVQQLPL